MKLEGWGRYPRTEGLSLWPATLSEIPQLLDRPLIPRGCGRSYGDSALASVTLETGRCDHLLAFDESSGLLHCQAGASLNDILAVFVPLGWFLPVTPGTRFVSVGGAIASDVHGKNHHLDGCFSTRLEQIELLLADGSRVVCSHSERAELFRATCGGMGLTGVILTARLRLRKISSAHIDQTTHKAANLEEALELFERHHASTYSVAWIDCLAQGAALGRSLLMLGEHSPEGELQLPKKPALSIPMDMPGFLLNRQSMQAFNALYYNRVRAPESHQRVSYESFFYPLDGVRQWNRLYGREGFIQYQFVIPREAGLEGLHTILRRIAASRRSSFLAVLKAFGPSNDNLLSFPLEGYTLALDFKMEPNLLPLLEELDAMVLGHGGRLYLTKDARMSAATFKRSYPNWQQFQSVRASVGALGRFASLQSRRLGLDE